MQTLRQGTRSAKHLRNRIAAIVRRPPATARVPAEPPAPARFAGDRCPSCGDGRLEVNRYNPAGLLVCRNCTSFPSRDPRDLREPAAA